MEPYARTKKIKAKALELGFHSVGITTADDFTAHTETLAERMPDYAMFKKRLEPGAKIHDIHPEAKSIICMTWDFSKIAYPEQLRRSVGRAYLSRGYVPKPDTMNGIRVREFHSYLRSLGCSVYDDVEPPARMACARAGITTFGANNFAYAEGCGSFVILHTAVVDAELIYDAPTVERRCPPNCQLCMDACPTGALAEKGRLIPEKCLAYNHWVGRRGTFGPIPEELREVNGCRIHGCDICQEACPRNKKVLDSAGIHDPFLDYLDGEFDLEKVLLLDEDYYTRVVKPIMYNYIKDLDVFRRNAAVALGNTGDVSHIPALQTAIETCERDFVVEAAQWAIQKLGQDPGHTPPC